MTQTTATKKPEMLTVRQVAQRGIMPERAIRRKIAEGKIPVVRSGKTMYLNYALLCEQLQSGEGAIWN